MTEKSPQMQEEQQLQEKLDRLHQRQQQAFEKRDWAEYAKLGLLIGGCNNKLAELYRQQSNTG